MAPEDRTALRRYIRAALEDLDARYDAVDGWQKVVPVDEAKLAVEVAVHLGYAPTDMATVRMIGEFLSVLGDDAA
jgi:hypothetical protein